MGFCFTCFIKLLGASSRILEASSSRFVSFFHVRVLRAADIINYDEKKSLLPGLPNEADPVLTAEKQVYPRPLLKPWIGELKK
ncbi:hypothetical protein RhiLY_08374 [Ceratobasidium sp. AG-Ba]|nr:hypothetical protein RhiLY_08374 [Ceratobasidium sp. AG-Ba]